MKRVIFAAACLAVTACQTSVRPETSDNFVPQGVQYREYKTTATLYWTDHAIHLNKDSKVMIIPTQIVVTQALEEKTGVTSEQLKEMADFLDKELIRVFSKYNLVAWAPGPDVMTMSLAITDLVPSNRFMNTLSAITPVGAVVSAGKYAVTGRPTNVGEIELAMILRNSETNQIVAAVKSRQIGDKYDFKGHTEDLGDTKTKITEWVEQLVQPWLDARKGKPGVQETYG